MMKIGKKLWVMIILVAVALLGFLWLPKQSSSIAVMQEKHSYVTYLLYENTLVEVASETSHAKKEKQIEEAIYYMKQNVSPFTPLLEEDTQLESVNIKGEKAILDFSTLSYQDTQELHVVESLLYTITQFNGITSMQLCVEGKPLTNMPNKKTPIKNLTKDFGINHMDANQQFLHVGSYYPVYYQMEIEGHMYPVIRSVKVDSENPYIGIVKELFTTPNSASHLQQPLAKEKIRQEKTGALEKDTLHLYLSKEALDKQHGVKTKVVNHLKRNLKGIDGVKYLSIHVSDEIIAINGKNKIKL